MKIEARNLMVRAQSMELSLKMAHNLELKQYGIVKQLMMTEYVNRRVVSDEVFRYGIEKHYEETLRKFAQISTSSVEDLTNDLEEISLGNGEK